jgi:hypothetical protein
MRGGGGFKNVAEDLVREYYVDEKRQNTRDVDDLGRYEFLSVYFLINFLSLKENIVNFQDSVTGLWPT